MEDLGCIHTELVFSRINVSDVALHDSGPNTH